MTTPSAEASIKTMFPITGGNTHAISRRHIPRENGNFCIPQTSLQPATEGANLVAGDFFSIDRLGRSQRLNHYIASLKHKGDISDDVAFLAWSIWRTLAKNNNALLVPDASAGPNSEFLYTWDKAEHHLELEISASGQAEFFYRDRKTEQLWEADYSDGTPLTEDILNKLRLFH